MTTEITGGTRKPSWWSAIPEFHRGLLAGILGASLLVGLMAAGGLSQNPVTVIDTIVARGVRIDDRIARLDPNVRRGLLCVALNILMESRGEPNVGQIAVGWVTKTRAAERDVPLCSVVFEQSQFSWTAYPLRRIVQVAFANQETFLEAQDWAWKVLVDGMPDPTHGANHFYAQKLIRPPAWVSMATAGSRVVLGGHTFIRIPYRRSPWARG